MKFGKLKTLGSWSNKQLRDQIKSSGVWTKDHKMQMRIELKSRMAKGIAKYTTKKKSSNGFRINLPKI